MKSFKEENPEMCYRKLYAVVGEGKQAHRGMKRNFGLDKLMELNENA